MFLITSFKTGNKGECGDVLVFGLIDLGKSPHYLLFGSDHILSVLQDMLFSFNFLFTD